MRLLQVLTPGSLRLFGKLKLFTVIFFQLMDFQLILIGVSSNVVEKITVLIIEGKYVEPLV